MSKKNILGNCHLCGTYGNLTFEHVPPRAAFNDKPVIALSFDDAFELRPEDAPKGPVQQRGMGKHTLCADCNNKTGHWYGGSFVDWCYEGLTILQGSKGKPTLYHSSYSYPLRIIKQIATMFFTACSDGFASKNEELVRFVLNKKITGLSPKYRFYTYYNIEGRLRFSNIVGLINIEEGTSSFISEITFPPFGYVMSLDSVPEDKQLVEISAFANYGYYELASISRRFSLLQTYMPSPGDYRPYDPAL
jgi:hypothetical protein